MGQEWDIWYQNLKKIMGHWYQIKVRCPTFIRLGVPICIIIGKTQLSSAMNIIKMALFYFRPYYYERQLAFGHLRQIRHSYLLAQLATPEPGLAPPVKGLAFFGSAQISEHILASNLCCPSPVVEGVAVLKVLGKVPIRRLGQLGHDSIEHIFCWRK